MKVSWPSLLFKEGGDEAFFKKPEREITGRSSRTEAPREPPAEAAQPNGSFLAKPFFQKAGGRAPEPTLRRNRPQGRRSRMEVFAEAFFKKLEGEAE
ncbi:hypothetical protein [Youxingia wuxianensis]|uniref:Uncharacterized protein n=1 Tax=Youxingia wuxianensis TaxID=2763678 RepID=A0A926ERN8_9FIRM|nr:hypothetical protein [Youxingia wuxianensis]MBC8586461.1 hypothetical protein [Youxingia wuxianensis]